MSRLVARVGIVPGYNRLEPSQASLTAFRIARGRINDLNRRKADLTKPVAKMRKDVTGGRDDGLVRLAARNPPPPAGRVRLSPPPPAACRARRTPAGRPQTPHP